MHGHGQNWRYLSNYVQGTLIFYHWSRFQWLYTEYYLDSLDPQIWHNFWKWVTLLLCTNHLGVFLQWVIHALNSFVMGEERIYASLDKSIGYKSSGPNALMLFGFACKSPTFSMVIIKSLISISIIGRWAWKLFIWFYGEEALKENIQKYQLFCHLSWFYCHHFLLNHLLNFLFFFCC